MDEADLRTMMVTGCRILSRRGLVEGFGHLSVRLEDEAKITMAVLRKAQRELNGMPHVNREPAFPDHAIRLLFGEASSA